MRLVKSLAPQLRDCMFIDCCDKTKERGTLKAGQGRAGFLKIKTHCWRHDKQVDVKGRREWEKKWIKRREKEAKKEAIKEAKKKK